MQNVKQNQSLFQIMFLKNALLGIYLIHIQAKICHERFAIRDL